MSGRLRAVALGVLVLAASVAVGACGPQTNDIAQRVTAPDRVGPAAIATSTPAASETDVTLQVGSVRRSGFAVDEGVWWLGHGYPRVGREYDDQRNGLLGHGYRDAVWVNGPVLYGRYPLSVGHTAERPPVPRWCEDVVEVPYTHRGGPLLMGSFETAWNLGPLPADDYRVRLCVRGLDDAQRETAVSEFVGDDYRRHTSRHLFTLWPAPRSGERIMRVGSEFAAREHARVASGG